MVSSVVVQALCVAAFAVPQSLVSQQFVRSQLAINGVTVHESVQSVITTLGEPDSVIHSNDDLVGETTTLHFSFGHLLFVDDHMVNFECGGAGRLTADGVRVADATEHVRRTYGEPSSTRGSPLVLTYFPMDLDCGLRFIIAAGRVESVHLWCDIT